MHEQFRLRTQSTLHDNADSTQQLATVSVAMRRRNAERATRRQAQEQQQGTKHRLSAPSGTQGAVQKALA